MNSVSILAKTMAALSFLYAATVFRNDPHLLSLQYKLKMTSLSSDWIENEHFLLVFMKTSVFMPKTGSINSGTGYRYLNSYKLSVFFKPNKVLT
jgi:hypothetical protein